jgi:hypothetical protein
MVSVVAIGTNAAQNPNTNISCSIILGHGAQATGPNQFVLGSSDAPLSASAGGSFSTTASCFLITRVNGTFFRIPLLSHP